MKGYYVNILGRNCMLITRGSQRINLQCSSFSRSTCSTESAIKFVLFQVSIDELQQAAKLLVEALFIRSKYMAMSMQSFCSTTARKLKTVHEDFDTEAQYFHLKRHSIDDDLGRYSPSLECKVPSSISLT